MNTTLNKTQIKLIQAAIQNKDLNDGVPTFRPDGVRETKSARHLVKIGIASASGVGAFQVDEEAAKKLIPCHLIIFINEKSMSFRGGDRTGTQPHSGDFQSIKKEVSYIQSIVPHQTFEIHI